MDYLCLRVEVSNNICYITISREDKMNALNRNTLVELHEALVFALKNDQVRGIVLRGAGEKSFVAGADISEFAHFDQDQGRDLAREGQTKVFDLIHNAPKPIIAAINGFALGGGLELALACHIRIACSTAKLGLPEVSLGLIPGYGGTQRLTHLVGRGMALEIILTGNMIHAEKALQIGLINHIVPADELLTKAEEILGEITSRSPKAIEAAIRAVNASLVNDENGYEVEIEEFSKRFGTPEFKEGVEAFLQKRKPDF